MRYLATHLERNITLPAARKANQRDECHSELCRTGGNGARALFQKGGISHRFSKTSCRTPFISCSTEGVFTGHLFLSVSRWQEVDVDATFELFFGRFVEKRRDVCKEWCWDKKAQSSDLSPQIPRWRRVPTQRLLSVLTLCPRTHRSRDCTLHFTTAYLHYSALLRLNRVIFLVTVYIV